MWTLANIYGYHFDRFKIPIISIDYEFYYDWNNNIEEIIKPIGYWRYILASLVPIIMYLISLPIILLGEIQL